MNSQKGRKFMFLGLASLSFLPRTAAAIGRDTGIEASLVRFANNILLFEVSSATDVLIYFIAPIAGFYFIQKNMLSYGFEMFEERIDRSSYHRTDDDIPNGIKGLSIVTSFITVQFLGMFGAGILFATAIISVVLGAIMQLGLLEGLGGGGSSSSSSSSTRSTSSSNNTQPQGGSSGGGGSSTDWGSLIESTGNAINNLSSASNNSSSSSNRGPERSMDNALDMLERMKQKTSSGMSIHDILEKDAKTFNDAIDDAEQAINDGEVEMNSTHDLKKRCSQLVSDLMKFKNKTGSSNPKPQEIAQLEQDLNNKNRPLDQQAQKIAQDINRIKEAENSQLSHLEDEIDELHDAAELYAMLLGFVGRLPKPLDDFQSSQKLQKNFIKRGVKRGVIPKPAGAGKVVQFGQPYQQLANQLSNSLSQLEGELNDINHNINRAESLLEDEIKISKNEIKDIEASIESINKSGNLIDQVRSNITSSGNLDKNGVCQSLWNDLDYIENELDGVSSELSQLKTRMGGDSEYESKMAEELRDIYQG